MDRSPFLLKKARERAKELDLNVEWVEEDMRDFRRETAFDLALNLFTSFGYFEDDGENLGVLRNLARSLVPGGCCVLDVMGKERIARIFNPATLDEIEGSGLLLQRHTVIDDFTRMQNEWILLKEDGRRSFKFRHYLYSGRELRDMLLQAGFQQVELYGGLDGAPYDQRAQRLVAVARKE